MSIELPALKLPSLPSLPSRSMADHERYIIELREVMRSRERLLEARERILMARIAELEAEVAELRAAVSDSILDAREAEERAGL